jgi:hypothetical protein
MVARLRHQQTKIDAAPNTILVGRDVVEIIREQQAWVREDIGRQEWEMVLDVLIEIGDVHPVSVDFWELLAEAARQMMLDRSCRWCEWRAWEVQHGTVRATLSLVRAE